MQSLWHVLRGVWEVGLQLVAPRCCCICGRGLEATAGLERFVCPLCWDNLPVAPPSEALYHELVCSFGADELALSGVAALFHLQESSPAMRLIYAVKYHGAWELGVELGRVLGGLLPHLLPESVDLIIPVPIHPARRRERGYNQAEAIARGLAAIVQRPLSTEVIRRRIATVSQTRLNAEERRRNVADAFAGAAQASLVRSRNVLLVDDVLTTGATLNSCAETLLTLGARRVFAVAVAKAM